jgi:hypothetical protein
MMSPRISILDILIQQQGRHLPTKHPGSKSHRRHMGSGRQRRRDQRIRQRSVLDARVATVRAQDPAITEDEAVR